MRAGRWWAGLVLATVVGVMLAGCSGGQGDGGGGAGGSRSEAAPASAPAADAGKAAGGAGGVRLVDLGNRIVRTATVNLEVREGGIGDAISQATEVAARHKGIYVAATTSLPSDGEARGQVTFRVPVEAFEAVLRDLKALGTYRGEKSSTEDVTSNYIDLKGQLTAWRAQERVYLRLLDRARSIADVIAVQNQLQQVQSNIERLQGQVDYLEDQSSFSTIVLALTEPGAAGGQPRGTLVRAWEFALAGLVRMSAAALVLVVWLVPLAALGALVLLVVRLARRPRPAAG
ncbi:MAG TPA: DUF4349 domain-containing protein [Actinomycetota bacterium]|jgi:hypothetical protein|nr:DUF4349 domain-containing protein [Actinomycetota bacterium]